MTFKYVILKHVTDAILSLVTDSKPISKQQATLIGSTAVLMWATLALLTELAGDILPFQRTAMAFAIAFVLAQAWMWWRGIMRNESC